MVLFSCLSINLTTYISATALFITYRSGSIILDFNLNIIKPLREPVDEVYDTVGDLLDSQLTSYISLNGIEDVQVAAGKHTRKIILEGSMAKLFYLLDYDALLDFLDLPSREKKSSFFIQFASFVFENQRFLGYYMSIKNILSIFCPFHISLVYGIYI